MAVEPGLCLAWSETLKTCISHDASHLRNEFNYLEVHEFMNRSGLRAKGMSNEGNGLINFARNSLRFISS